MLLTGRWIDAQEALQIKLVNRVVPGDRLMETARGMAEKISAHDPDVITGIKQAVVRGMDLPLAQGLDLEKMLACQRGL
jgi:enoyl-CoA hydratase/carnithine racemase